MKKPAPTNENEQHNRQINPSTIRALRHMLAAVGNLQGVAAVTQQEQALLAETHLALRAQVRRLAGRGGAQ